MVSQPYSFRNPYSVICYPIMLKDEIQQLKEDVLLRLAELSDIDAILEYEPQVIGRKGSLTLLMKQIANVPAFERPELGQLINSVKKELELAFAAQSSKEAEAHSDTGFDVTLPGTTQEVGHLHPVTYAIEEIEAIFSRLGFIRRRYNEVEWDYYAFEALNMPADHPARDEWETFFISEKSVGPLGKIILTPHTSSGQVREMRNASKEGLPVRMLNIAKCYRRQIDISHVPMFHQFEGLVVDRDVTMTQLVGVLDYFVKQFFSPDRRVRLRPFHFRFTEPSFEVDISCGVCNAKGCAVCKQGWHEIGGAGMVHPNVLTAGGYDPDEFTGFAFGFGVERSYLMKNNLNIGDLRLLYSNDIRFLQQF